MTTFENAKVRTGTAHGDLVPVAFAIFRCAKNYRWEKLISSEPRVSYSNLIDSAPSAHLGWTKCRDKVSRLTVTKHNDRYFVFPDVSLQGTFPHCEFLIRFSKLVTRDMSTSSNDVQQFNVLYYKRKNKVHKSKGVSKMDGILKFHGPMVGLTTTEGVVIVAPRRETELAKHKYQEDDILNLGPYEVEIVSSSSRANLPTPMKTTKSQGSKRPLFKPLHSAVGGRSLASSAVVPQTTTSCMNEVTGNKTQESLRERSVLKPLPSKTYKVASTIKLAANKTTPETQPEDGEQIIGLPRPAWNKRSLPIKKAISGQYQPKAKRVLVSTQSRFLASETTLFPDAIGTIDLPHSIATVLQPHQRTGVSFVWNCLTGNAPVSPHASHAENPSYKGGCILADEMGLGKTLMTIATICALYRQKRDTVRSITQVNLFGYPCLNFF